MSAVAAIDCGTNSIRLLVARPDPANPGRFQQITRLMRIVRLGEGVDQTGRLSPRALQRTYAALSDYAGICADHGVQRIRMVATSATRDADNADEFAEMVRERLGIEAEVISGDQEAALSFAGAQLGCGSDVDAPVLVVDIGGGSTEFVSGHRQADAACSTNMGSVRVYERFFKGVVGEDGAMDPARPQVAHALRAAVSFIDATIAPAAAKTDFGSVRTLVGVAGTVTTVTAHALGLEAYDPARIDGARLAVADVMRSCNWLMSATVAQRAALGFMPDGRADVIGAGALVWQRIIEKVAAGFAGSGRELTHITTSEHDILDGIAASILA